MRTSWVQETEQMIESIEHHQQTLRRKIEGVQQELAQLEDELAHWRAVYQSYQRRTGQTLEKPSLLPQDLAQYSSLSYTKIINRVADENNDDIPMMIVSQIFKAKTKTPTNAASAAYTTLRRLLKQGKVIKVRPGLYRRVTATIGSSQELTRTGNHQQPQPALIDHEQGHPQLIKVS